MPVNQRSKYRGSRTCGGGTHKNRRGGGSRGGRGHSGGCKHHFVRYVMQGQRYGKHGFSHDQQADVGTIDVGIIDQRIDQLIAQGLATQQGDTVTLDASALGVEKVLGSGKVTRKLNISAKAFSEQAKTKIEGAGGQVLTT